MDKLFDNHNHSEFSFDGGRTSVLKTSRQAAAKKLGGICFTDHCDFFVPPMKAEHEHCVPEVFDIAARNAEIDRVNALIHSRELSDIPADFRIFKGIELGVQESQREKIAKVLEENTFDEIIASVHYLDDTDPFWGGYYEGKGWHYAYWHYLETLFEELMWLRNRFDIMGHFDYVTRYAPYPECSIYYKDYPDLLDQMLRFLSENGKALEINTKTYQDYNGRTPVLDKNILIRFRELGGEMISLGSDSHDAEMVGHNFEYFAGYVKSCGFRYLVHFENRKPIMLRNECPD